MKEAQPLEGTGNEGSTLLVSKPTICGKMAYKIIGDTAASTVQTEPVKHCAPTAYLLITC